MFTHLRRCRGYSLTELLVVLAIVGILAGVGVTMIGNKPSSSVRSVMDELEGVLLSAHQMASTTGRDVFIGTQGDWSGTSATPLGLAYRAGGTLNLTAAEITAALVQSESFHVARIMRAGVPSGLQREHANGGVVVSGSGWWASAQMGNKDIATVAPFNDAASGFLGIIADDTTNNLFKGGANLGSARISGASRRFTTTFWIGIVGLADGVPISGGPMGLLVVQANGATVYKFYNPGIRSGGDGNWRRL
jgi:prepilin-type N-terminal cleavage/methylation domain-containing protein